MKKYCANFLLTILVTAGLLGARVVKTFSPAAVLPQWNIPGLAAISLLALLAEHSSAPEERRHYVPMAGLSCLTFGVLPWAAGFLEYGAIWKAALAGAGVFTAVTWLFAGLQQRLQTEKSPKICKFLGAFGIFMAFQAFSGWLSL